jgi:hypothetical protein
VRPQTRKNAAALKRKNVSISFLELSGFKRSLETVIGQARRSKTNTLKTQPFAYCEERAIDDTPPEKTDNNTPAGALSR